MPLGIGALDDLFAGRTGLRSGALHEVVSSESRNAGSASGFALALLVRLMDARRGPVLWVQDARAAQENGQLHGPGLMRFGVDPARLIVVRPRSMEEVLWALEEGASCPVLCAVAGEVQGQHKALSLTATRRLALRAERSGVPIILLRHAAEQEPTAALTRWHVEPAHSTAPPLEPGGPHEAVGDPAWNTGLTRNRDGRQGHLTLEWQHAGRKFAAPAHSLALVRGPARGPDPAPAEAGIVQWRARG